MISKNHIIIGILLLGIGCLLSYIVLKEDPEPVVIPIDDGPYTKMIEKSDSHANYWESQSDSWRLIAKEAIASNDSLKKLKPKIKHEYHKVYVFNTTAGNTELDSVIRASW